MITLTITTPNGTIVAMNIPLDYPAALNSASTPASGVVIANETQTPVEAPIPAQESQPEVVSWSEASGKLSDSLEKLEQSCFEITVGEKEGDEGLGRIGGVGERKDRGEGEEKPEQTKSFFDIEFETIHGAVYVPPAKLVNKLIAAFGVEVVERELHAASLWLMTNPRKQKTMGGTGKFINAWLKRSTGTDKRGKRAPKQENRQETSVGSLISANAKETESGW